MIVNISDNGNSALTSTQGQCEFNFLKRKLNAEDTMSSHQQINNEHGNSSEAYQASEENAWKKRHIEEDAASVTHAVSSCFDVNTFTTSSVSEYTDGSGHNDAVVSSTNGTDLTFNLIGSSFINDLFAYDANLIVPVSANLVSSSPLDGASTVPTFSTPTNVCINSSYDDGSNWQATDLLELDHRYNSGLHTEISQLHPTVTLKATQGSNSLAMQTTVEQSSVELDFLVPLKQGSRLPTQTSQTKYRQQSDMAATQATPPPPPNESESDFEDKNLSWLLNFKFDELPHLSPDVGAGNNGTPSASNSTTLSNSCQSNSSSPSSANGNSAQMAQNQRSRSPKSSNKAGKKFEELVMEVTAELDGNDMIVAENVVVEDTSIKAPKKPPFTYTELIEYALEDKGELTVSGIYQWISDRFPYYKSNDDRWKNSVRHNLSINPHFRKGVKAPQGAGHLWTISSGDSAENVLAWEHKKQRLDLFFKMESMNRERLQQHQQQMLAEQQQELQQQQQQQQQQAQQQQQSHNTSSPITNEEQNLYDEAAAAAAAITQEMLEHTGGQNCTTSDSQRLGTHILHELPFNDLMSDEELRKTAGQILNGIHREVEVQSIINTYHDVLLDNEDYLNPIRKDVAVNESSLRHTAQTPNHHNAASQYYVTEIDPMELGIQMSHHVDEEEEVLFNDEFNLNYFGYNAGNDIVA